MSGLATGPFDTEYAAAARLLADRLQSLAAPGPDGAPVWSGDDVDPLRSTDQRVVLTHGRLDDGLLTGRTGIATALALCAQLARPITVHQGHGSVIACRPLDGGRVEVGGNVALDRVRA